MSAEMEGWQDPEGILRRKGLQAGQRGMWPGEQGAVLELTPQLQQAERDQLLRDQGIEIPAVEGSEDYLGFVQATSDACHLGGCPPSQILRA